MVGDLGNLVTQEQHHPPMQAMQGLSIPLKKNGIGLVSTPCRMLDIILP